jgi:hypothetical protein
MKPNDLDLEPWLVRDGIAQSLTGSNSLFPPSEHGITSLHVDRRLFRSYFAGTRITATCRYTLLDVFVYGLLANRVVDASSSEQ